MAKLAAAEATTIGFQVGTLLRGQFGARPNICRGLWASVSRSGGVGSWVW